MAKESGSKEFVKLVYASPITLKDFFLLTSSKERYHVESSLKIWNVYKLLNLMIWFVRVISDLKCWVITN
jgi:hypothetical protein